MKNTVEKRITRKTKLNKKERERIQRDWADSDIEWKIVSHVPPEIQEELNKLVSTEMGMEGIFIHDDAANFYGAEAARRFKDRALGWAISQFNQYSDQIHDTVCVKSDYCKKRKQKKFEKEGYLVAIGVADALIAIGIGIPIPITLISVYMVKRGILDNWCHCSKT